MTTSWNCLLYLSYSSNRSSSRVSVSFSPMNSAEISPTIKPWQGARHSSCFKGIFSTHSFCWGPHKGIYSSILCIQYNNNNGSALRLRQALKHIFTLFSGWLKSFMLRGTQLQVPTISFIKRSSLHSTVVFLPPHFLISSSRPRKDFVTFISFKFSRAKCPPP